MIAHIISVTFKHFVTHLSFSYIFWVNNFITYKLKQQNEPESLKGHNPHF